jgi:hypothetical protein
MNADWKSRRGTSRWIEAPDTRMSEAIIAPSETMLMKYSSRLSRRQRGYKPPLTDT